MLMRISMILPVLGYLISHYSGTSHETQEFTFRIAILVWVILMLHELNAINLRKCIKDMEIKTENITVIMKHPDVKYEDQ